MGRSRASCLSAGRFRRTQIVFLHRANRPSERRPYRVLLSATRAVGWRKEGKRKTHWERARVELRARALSAAAQEASALHKILSRTRASALRESLWRTRARRAGTLAPHRIVSQAKTLWRARAWRAWAPAPHKIRWRACARPTFPTLASLKSAGDQAWSPMMRSGTRNRSTVTSL